MKKISVLLLSLAMLDKSGQPSALTYRTDGNTMIMTDDNGVETKLTRIE